LVPEINTILFLVVVVLGALVQTVTGFAMGLIIMAGVALFNITDIAFAAAVVSFISLTNAGVALRYGHRHVDWLFVRRILLGMIPAMALGIALLTYLSEHYYALLKLLLGFVIILAGTSLMLAPAPFGSRSSSLMFTVFGGPLQRQWCPARVLCVSATAINQHHSVQSVGSVWCINRDSGRNDWCIRSTQHGNHADECACYPTGYCCDSGSKPLCTAGARSPGAKVGLRCIDNRRYLSYHSKSAA
jgi:hypothetical protein